MANTWKDILFCALECHRCHKNLNPHDERILSCFDHEAICMDCKSQEERRPDYEETSKQMIGQCLIDIEMQQGDPQSYCYSHFYPYKCQ
jgi:hypothetical protein